MSAFDQFKKFEHEFSENLAEGFWTPEDPLTPEERDRLDHLKRELREIEPQEQPGPK
ncbi:hypothetical protein JST97_31555 [bacterium]|nr:hypothetical protein [bacterium]